MLSWSSSQADCWQYRQSASSLSNRPATSFIIGIFKFLVFFSQVLAYFEEHCELQALPALPCRGCLFILMVCPAQTSVEFKGPTASLGLTVQMCIANTSLSTTLMRALKSWHNHACQDVTGSPQAISYHLCHADVAGSREAGQQHSR